MWGTGSRKHLPMFADGHVQKEDVCSKCLAGAGGSSLQTQSWGSEKPLPCAWHSLVVWSLPQTGRGLTGSEGEALNLDLGGQTQP